MVDIEIIPKKICIPLIISKSPYNKIYIPESIPLGMCEAINSDYYNINKMILTNKQHNTSVKNLVKLNAPRSEKCTFIMN